MYSQMPVGVHREVSLSPTGDIVQIAGMLGRPALGRLNDQRALPGVSLHSYLQNFQFPKNWREGQAENVCYSLVNARCELQWWLTIAVCTLQVRRKGQGRGCN